MFIIAYSLALVHALDVFFFSNAFHYELRCTRLIWSILLPFWENLASQKPHLYGFSPRWTPLMCLCKFPGQSRWQKGQVPRFPLGILHEPEISIKPALFFRSLKTRCDSLRSLKLIINLIWHYLWYMIGCQAWTKNSNSKGNLSDRPEVG